ncbi:MAG: hypothetical protein Q4E69_04925 [Bacilli bacterium]|nr:hypothetical protein [Bacilli bacterium]
MKKTMKKILNFIKKHKLLVLFIILLIVAAVFAIKVFLIFSDTDETAIYGERLNGADYVEIDVSKSTDKVKAKVGDLANGVTVRKQGRIINVILNLKDETTRDAAKDISNQLLGEFTDQEKAYYDFQIFLNKTNEDAQFPVIGYKHHTKAEIKWTKDR